MKFIVDEGDAPLVQPPVPDGLDGQGALEDRLALADGDGVAQARHPPVDRRVSRDGEGLRHGEGLQDDVVRVRRGERAQAHARRQRRLRQQNNNTIVIQPCG